MASFFRKLSFFRKVVTILLIVAFVNAVFIWRYNRQKNSADAYEFVQVRYGDITEEVLATGKVKAAENISLAFERTGKIARVWRGVGETVRAGEIVAELESGTLAASVLQARANFETEQANLAELEAGTRPEDIAASEVKLANAERTLRDAQKFLADARIKADNDLAEVYSEAVTAAQAAMQTAKSAIISITNLQSSYFGDGISENDIRLADAKAAAIQELFGVSGAGHWNTGPISALQGGLYGAIASTSSSAAPDVLDPLLARVLPALQRTKQAVDAVVVIDKMSSADKTTASTERANMSDEITAMTGKMQAITAQRSTNIANINAEKSDLTSAENAVASARSDLDTKKAGTIPQQIDAARARVKAAQATLVFHEAEIAQIALISPIDGIISRQDAKPGEIVSANSMVTFVISRSNLEIEAKIPEANIAKIAAGQSATVRLDAYPGESFGAAVAFVEPAETVTDGITIYKVTLSFSKDDARLRSGMTADIRIATRTHSHVLVVPQRAVVTRDHEAVVRIFVGAAPVEKPVQTGISGIDGNIEISAGLTENDSVIVGEKE
ncbi:MAG: efflux RND transporter periplasmic adaptor subunit [Patescibacteria group bacterium]